MKPILFQIGDAIISSHPFMLSLSFVVGSLLIIYGCRGKNISINKLLGLIISIQIAAIFGSRFLFVLNNYPQFESDLSMMFSLSPGGFALNGGLILGVLTGILYTKFNRLPSWDISDYAAISFAAGIFLTKIGCFLSGCCFGKETSLFWGVRFPIASLASYKYGVFHQIHPTQLYEAFSGILIFIILLIINKHRRFSGQLFLLFIILYSFCRAVNDAFRGDATYSYIFNLSQTQFLSILFGVTSIIIYLVRSSADIAEIKLAGEIE